MEILKVQLFELKQRFVQRMPDRIAAIGSALGDCTDGGGEAMDRLERQFHTLAGTAGTYDLNAIAAAAFEGEEACAELNKAPLESEGFVYLMLLVDQVRGALAADVPEMNAGTRTVLSAACACSASEQTGVSCDA
jgi:HPt (histidine-containing phosphotransfer) domain-containing protein